MHIVFKIKSMFSFLLLIELFALLFYIDIMPILYLGFLCIFVILLKQKRSIKFVKRNSNSTNINSKMTIIGAIIFGILSIGIAFLYSYFGLNNIGINIFTLLNNNIFFRYAIYGISFPLFYSFIMSWLYFDFNPLGLGALSFKYSSIFLCITLFTGLFVCFNWVNYSQVAVNFLSIF